MECRPSCVHGKICKTVSDFTNLFTKFAIQLNVTPDDITNLKNIIGCDTRYNECNENYVAKRTKSFNTIIATKSFSKGVEIIDIFE